MSFDGCFIFQGNYYSVPESLVGEKVRVFCWGDRIRVYENSGSEFVCNHTTVGGRGKYVVSPAHARSLGPPEYDYFIDTLESFKRMGAHIESFGALLFERHGIYAVRKFWQLSGLAKQYTRQDLDCACKNAYNLRQVMFRLGEKKPQKRGGRKTNEA